MEPPTSSKWKIPVDTYAMSIRQKHQVNDVQISHQMTCCLVQSFSIAISLSLLAMSTTALHTGHISVDAPHSS